MKAANWGDLDVNILSDGQLVEENLVVNHVSHGHGGPVQFFDGTLRHAHFAAFEIDVGFQAMGQWHGFVCETWERHCRWVYGEMPSRVPCPVGALIFFLRRTNR